MMNTANILKTLSDENRLRIIQLLLQGELCVCEIENILDLKQSNLSRHLTKLRQEGIIERSKTAQWVYYTISDAFSSENKSLLIFLKEKFENEDVFVTDYKKYKTFKDNNISCETIVVGN